MRSFTARDGSPSSNGPATRVTANRRSLARLEWKIIWIIVLSILLVFDCTTKFDDFASSAVTFQKDVELPADTVYFAEGLIRVSRSPVPIPPAPLAKVTDSPHVAWLLGYPNSGAKTVSRLVQASTNRSVGTNYPTHGQPTVPLLPGPRGENGPFLDFIEGQSTDVASHEAILTYSHCAGTCNREDCSVDEDILTPRAFLAGCLSGTRVERQEDGKLVRTSVIYSPSLLTKAVHVFRHPYENVVARFHEKNAKSKRSNATGGYSQDLEGFRAWCAKSDARHLVDEEEERIDPLLRRLIKKTPCFHEFYRYVQWHNLAFAATRSLYLPSVVVHYRDFDEDLVGTRDKLVDFLGLPLIHPNASTSFNFQRGNKPENHFMWYYTIEDMRAVEEFVKEFATAETWEQLQPYFEGNLYHSP